MPNPARLAFPESHARAVTDINNLRHQGYSRGIREHTLMNVSLTPELEEFVSTKVRSGRYNSASEVVREALRLPEERDSLPKPPF